MKTENNEISYFGGGGKRLRFVTKAYRKEIFCIIKSFVTDEESN